MLTRMNDASLPEDGLERQITIRRGGADRDGLLPVDRRYRTDDLIVNDTGFRTLECGRGTADAVKNGDFPLCPTCSGW